GSWSRPWNGLRGEMGSDIKSCPHSPRGEVRVKGNRGTDVVDKGNLKTWPFAATDSQARNATPGAMPTALRGHGTRSGPGERPCVSGPRNLDISGSVPTPRDGSSFLGPLTQGRSPGPRSASRLTGIEPGGLWHFDAPNHFATQQIRREYLGRRVR